MTSIDNLTIGEAKELAKLFGATTSQNHGLNSQLGEKVIIRTYSAGVWFGKLVEKSGNEVILEDARRMWRWHAKKSVSLSGVAIYGITRDKSNICPAIKKQWLEAIEIISLTKEAIESIEGVPDVEAS